MNEGAYQYSATPTRNPLRWLLAAWRVTQDLGNTNEAAIVEIGFSRSRFGRRYAGWEQSAARLRADARTADAVESKTRLGALDLDQLARLPEGTLGHTFATHCRAAGIDPNLVDVPVASEGDYVMAHLFETHDIWHVVTGWGNDELGEVGLGGFYLAQLELPLIALMLALILVNTVTRAPGTLRERMDALVAGYTMGKRAAPLFGVPWEQRWSEPVDSLRASMGIESSVTSGRGILGARLRDAA